MKILREIKKKGKIYNKILIEQNDLENLRKRAKIGENYLIKKINTNISLLENLLEKQEEISETWRDIFEMEIVGYRRMKTIANSVGILISEYDKQVLDLTEEYCKITGAIDIPIDYRGINNRILEEATA